MRTEFLITVESSPADPADVFDKDSFEIVRVERDNQTLDFLPEGAGPILTEVLSKIDSYANKHPHHLNKTPNH